MLRNFRPLLLAMLAVASAWATPADAKIYKCDAVENEARVGARDRDVVSVNGDTSKKVCKFSVNGISAGSPPDAEIDQAFRMLFEAGRLFTDRVDLRSLATAMLAAGPDTDANELESVLRATEDRLQTCFAQARERNFSDEWGGISGTQFCTVVSRAEPERNAIEFGPFAMSYHPFDYSRTLAFFVVRESLINGIFIPVE